MRGEVRGVELQISGPMPRRSYGTKEGCLRRLCAGLDAGSFTDSKGPFNRAFEEYLAYYVHEELPDYWLFTSMRKVSGGKQQEHADVVGYTDRAALSDLLAQTLLTDHIQRYVLYGFTESQESFQLEYVPEVTVRASPAAPPVVPAAETLSNRVRYVLQHYNLGDTEETIGVSVTGQGRYLLLKVVEHYAKAVRYHNLFEVESALEELCMHTGQALTAVYDLAATSPTSPALPLLTPLQVELTVTCKTVDKTK